MDPNAVMAVLPADHIIEKEAEFRSALVNGAEAAEQGCVLITFGIVPHRPETGYGYIKLGPRAQIVGSSTIFRVERFVEKPTRSVAEEYVASGDYMWNSGMFIWKARDIIHAFEDHLPLMNRALEEISRCTEHRR